jgi:hypothetical protein
LGARPRTRLETGRLLEVIRIGWETGHSRTEFHDYDEAERRRLELDAQQGAQAYIG